MADIRQAVTHRFGGGFATDFGPTLSASPDKDGTLQLPFLVNAENCVYEFDGGPSKMPGTTKLNSSAVGGGAVVKGLFDYWKQGSSGTATQKRVIHVGTLIMQDDADGTFANLFTGLAEGAIPAYSIFDDILIISSDASADVPKSWDQSTAQDLAGSPPNFAFSATHKNKSWAAGVISTPSRLYFSVNLNPEDWTNSGSGSIDINPNDGDRITGIISHKDELWVFKGPYRGSIHRVTGSAPTGTDSYAVKPFVSGLGAVGHNTLFRARDDIGFMWSDGSIHSLNATAAFGDYSETALSRPINKYIREHVNADRLGHAWAATWDSMGIVLFSIPIDTFTNNNILLMMDYRFDPVRWGIWPALGGGALATVIDATNNNVPTVFEGGNDGFVRILGSEDHRIDGTTAIAMKVTTPFLDYQSPLHMKTFTGGSIGIAPKNTGNITLTWRRDDEADQTVAIAQTGGAALDSFVLGTDTLGGERFIERMFEAEEGGEFRSIQYEITNSTGSEDVEVHSLTSDLVNAAKSKED